MPPIRSELTGAFGHFLVGLRDHHRFGWCGTTRRRAIYHPEAEVWRVGARERFGGTDGTQRSRQWTRSGEKAASVDAQIVKSRKKFEIDK